MSDISSYDSNLERKGEKPVPVPYNRMESIPRIRSKCPLQFEEFDKFEERKRPDKAGSSSSFDSNLGRRQVKVQIDAESSSYDSNLEPKMKQE